MYYPLFLDISLLDALIVGGGNVGLRKANTLLQAGIRKLTVLDIASPKQVWHNLTAEYQQLSFEVRPFAEEDVAHYTLVFACTNNDTLNTAIATACKNRGILCNCATAPHSGNMIVPVHVHAGELQAALSTGGASPALARAYKDDLQLWLRPRAAMALLMKRIRPYILASAKDTQYNTRIFRALVASPLSEALGENNAARCEEILRDILPEALHRHTAEFLYALF